MSLLRIQTAGYADWSDARSFMYPEDMRYQTRPFPGLDIVMEEQDEPQQVIIAQVPKHVFPKFVERVDFIVLSIGWDQVCLYTQANYHRTKAIEFKNKRTMIPPQNNSKAKIQRNQYKQ
jgi:hypothetical protein